MTDTAPTVKFSSYTCRVELGYYANRRLAIKLLNAIDDPSRELYSGENIATATVNVPEIDIDDSQVIIKSYSENEGMIGALLDADLITNPRSVNIGHVNVHVADKTDTLLELETNISKTKKPRI